jgi:hypothetical protein
VLCRCTTFGRKFDLFNVEKNQVTTIKLVPIHHNIFIFNILILTYDHHCLGPFHWKIYLKKNILVPTCIFTSSNLTPFFPPPDDDCCMTQFFCAHGYFISKKMMKVDVVDVDEVQNYFNVWQIRR